LIVCEGKETERRYFEAAIEKRGLLSVDVVIAHDCDSAPISVVQYAIDRCLREGRPEDGGYTAVFCVFDRDQHESYQRALAKIDAFKSRVIVPVPSIPCFEYWLVLHFYYTRAPYTPSGGRTASDRAVDELRKIEGFADYEKSIKKHHLDNLMGRLPEAIKNAKKAADDAIATEAENPCTKVFKVLEALDKLEETSDVEAAKSNL